MSTQTAMPACSSAAPGSPSLGGITTGAEPGMERAGSGRSLRPYYSHAGITIYHGDSLALMRNFRADVVITDPPYGVEFRGEHWDKEIPDWLPSAMGVSRAVLFTTAPTTMWDYPRPDCVLCWARPASSSRAPSGGFNHWSPVLVYGGAKFPVDLLSLHAIANASPKGYGHPCPKPEKLMRWLVEHSTKPGETVLDPFMGQRHDSAGRKRPRAYRHRHRARRTILRTRGKTLGARMPFLGRRRSGIGRKPPGDRRDGERAAQRLAAMQTVPSTLTAEAASSLAAAGCIFQVELPLASDREFLGAGGVPKPKPKAKNRHPMDRATKPHENKFHVGNGEDGKHYWLTPPALRKELQDEFAFDMDVCPFPKPADFDALTAEWGQSNYANIPFGSVIGHDGKKKGPTAWARKAIGESRKGKRVVLLYPIDKWILMMLAAGAKVRNLGDVRWCATEDGTPGKGTGRHIAAFILEGGGGGGSENLPAAEEKYNDDSTTKPT